MRDKIKSLIIELEGAATSKASAEADAKLQEEMLQLRRKVEEMQQLLLAEK